LRRAGFQAHNRWLVDLCSSQPHRHAGVALIDLEEIAAAVDDASAARAAGLTGGILVPPGLPSPSAAASFWHHPPYAPLWDVCEDLDMTVNVHVAGVGADYGPTASARWINSTEIFWVTRRPVWLFIWSGILERHPRLRLAVTEAGGAWVPEMLATMEYL